MSELRNPQPEVFARDDSGYKHDDVVLLDNKQWSYVQRRYELTPRERQVAELICQGLRNGSIARRLRIRPGTVKTHTRNIYRKARVKSKIAMLLAFVSDARAFPADHEGTHSIALAD